MRTPILLKKVLHLSFTACFAVGLIGPSLSVSSPAAFAASSRPNLSADDLSKKAIALFSAGKFQDAIELENQAIKATPNYWLPHSILSVFLWQRNQYDAALKEGKEAVRLAGDNAQVTLNLALMNQQMGFFETAIPLYKKAIKLTPTNWSPRIGLSQSLISSANGVEGLRVLQEMNACESTDFEWWHKLSNSFSRLDKPDLAAEAAQKAVATAKTPEQKAAGNAALLMELIKAKEIDRALALQIEVLQSKPRDEQLYIRILSALCPPANPAAGKALMAAAIENGLSSSSGYFKLGQVMEQKADVQSENSAVRDTWLTLAEQAYREGAKAAPGEAKYYLALAAVLDRRGRMPEMIEMLTKAKSYSADDPLTLYLVSRLKLVDNDIAGRLKERLTGVTPAPYQLNLAREEFSLENLQCNCKLNAVQHQLQQQSGIKLVTFTRREKPFRGALLVDQSFGSAQAFENVGRKDMLKFHIAGTHPVFSVNEAIKIAQTLRDDEQPANTWSFVIDAPKMPAI